MLQNLSREIRECLLNAEQSKRMAETALTTAARKDYLDMEQRWLSLARSYEFAERLSNFIAPFGKPRQQKNRPPQSTAGF